MADLTPTAVPDAVPARRDEAANRRAANRAVGLSAVGLALTGAVELFLALFTGSVGLLGDALHNLSDVSTSAVVFLGFWVSKRPASDRYPYGYERAEDLAGLGVALIIWGSAGLAAWESVHKFLLNGPTTHLGWGMVGAVIGVAGNQVVARYKLVVGRRIHSTTLVADARHSWLDAVSSLGALGGLVAVAAGWRLGDPVAGFAVTLFIAHVGWQVTSDVLHHLMDGVEPETLEAARRAAEVVGVTVVAAKGRWLGRSLVVEVELALPSLLTLAQSASETERVRDAVLAAVPEVHTALVSARPVDDRQHLTAPACPAAG